jgi:magnesium transporter
MTPPQTRDISTLLERITTPLAENDLAGVAGAIGSADTDQLVSTLERLNPQQRAIAYRLLPKDRALEVFEDLTPSLQGDLIQALRDAEVATIFAGLDPDDRVWLVDELPASLAARLLRGLPDRERQLTAEVIGYPQDSIGRRMSPEYVSTRADQTAGEALDRVRARLDDAETVYTLPVLEDSRRVLGVVGLRDLLGADPIDSGG